MDSASSFVGHQNRVYQIGPFLLGPQLGSSPVKSMSPFLSRRDGTDEFYTIKVLTIPDPDVVESTDDTHGKMLLHTEYKLLRRLDGLKGIVQQYGMYKDRAEVEDDLGRRMVDRVSLVLECYMPNDSSPKDVTNLQQYVLQKKRLEESLALNIFYNAVKIVEKIHKKNVVHRDLKLGNFVLDKNTMEVTLINFGLGRCLASEDEQLSDQRGSPAYISPEVISGKPYLGKPSDMWSLGVMLFTMLYGRFPFYDTDPVELFRKIRLGVYTMQTDNFTVSHSTIELIQTLLLLDPEARLTVSKTLTLLDGKVRAEEALLVDFNLQVVPDMNPGKGDEYQPRVMEFQPILFPGMDEEEIERVLTVRSNLIVQLRTAESLREPQNQASSSHVDTKVISSGIVPSVDDGSRERVMSTMTPPLNARDRARARLVARRRRRYNWRLNAAVASARRWRMTSSFTYILNQERLRRNLASR